MSDNCGETLKGNTCDLSITVQLCIRFRGGKKKKEQYCNLNVCLMKYFRIFLQTLEIGTIKDSLAPLRCLKKRKKKKN